MFWSDWNAAVNNNILKQAEQILWDGLSRSTWGLGGWGVDLIQTGGRWILAQIYLLLYGAEAGFWNSVLWQTWSQCSGLKMLSWSCSFVDQRFTHTLKVQLKPWATTCTPLIQPDSCQKVADHSQVFPQQNQWVLLKLLYRKLFFLEWIYILLLFIFY